MSTATRSVFIGLLLCSSQLALADGQTGGGQPNGDGWWQARLRAAYLNPSIQTSAFGFRAFGISGDVYGEVSADWAVASQWAVEAAIGTPALIASYGDGERLTAMPITFTGQFAPIPSEGFRPYIGIGAHYTSLYLAHSGSADSVSGSHFGFVVQAGADVYIHKNVLVGLDLRYLTNIKLSGRVAGAYVSSSLNTVVVAAGIGYRWLPK